MKCFILVLVAALLGACAAKNAERPTEAAKRQYVDQQNPVEVMVLHNGPFLRELVNNGKLVALRKSELQFRVGEQLEKLAFHNGDKIKTGQLIAELNPFTYRQQVSNIEIQLKRAR
ncbi:MAG: hypothetical protein ACM3RX_02055, partial [Methanococcaceae archaeon]